MSIQEIKTQVINECWSPSGKFTGHTPVLDRLLESLSYSIEELDKADKQLIKLEAQVASYHSAILEGCEPHLTMETFQRLNEDNITLRKELEEFKDAAREAVEWSRANAIPGNPGSIRRLARLLKEGETDESSRD